MPGKMFSLSEVGSCIKQKFISADDGAKLLYTKPVIALRRITLDSHTMKTTGDYSSQLVREYHLVLFRASIKALNCDVVEIAPSGRDKDDPSGVEYSYVRDPAVILHDKNLVISTKGNEYYSSKDVIRMARELANYTSLIVYKSYFEGGNIFYIPSKQTLLHGMDAGGHYKLISATNLKYTDRSKYYRIDPLQSNRALRDVLRTMGITVCGLYLNPQVIDHNDGLTRENWYYHLDCFMQVLPDGRLIILNKKILLQSSQDLLATFFRDKLIDLAYEDYLAKPVLLNFITIPGEGRFSIIAPALPEVLIKKLTQLGLDVYTPESLDVRKKSYNKEFSERVAAILQSEGYTDVSAENLATHLAKSHRGYLLSNGEFFPDSEVIRRRAEIASGVPLDDFYRKSDISFVYGGGGPHCLTTEIFPSMPKVVRQEKSEMSANAFTFFKPLKDKSASSCLSEKDDDESEPSICCIS